MLSVVIPSLGGNLHSSLEALNSGSLVPDEVIICLPNQNHSVNNSSEYKNITILYSEKYGQVYQRLYGFRKAKGNYILQLDDDAIVSYN